MYILVDGYNVLKQTSRHTEITERERQRFINQLRNYAQRKGHVIIVVFDGGPTTWPTRTQKLGVTIIYSGTKQSADDVIKKMLQEADNKEVLLVSSDNELYTCARACHATVMDAVAFYTLIMHSIDAPGMHQKEKVIKTSHDENPYLDALMSGVKMPPEHKNEEETTAVNRKSPAITPSKKERELLKKIKKL